MAPLLAVDVPADPGAVDNSARNIPAPASLTQPQKPKRPEPTTGEYARGQKIKAALEEYCRKGDISMVGLQIKLGICHSTLYAIFDGYKSKISLDELAKPFGIKLPPQTPDRTDSGQEPDRNRTGFA